MSFATRVNAPAVQFDVPSLIKSKRRIKNMVKLYQKQIRDSNDEKYIYSKKQKVEILKEILKTYTQLLEE
jgi:hypothetical protein